MTEGNQSVPNRTVDGWKARLGQRQNEGGSTRHHRYSHAIESVCHECQGHLTLPRPLSLDTYFDSVGFIDALNNLTGSVLSHSLLPKNHNPWSTQMATLRLCASVFIGRLHPCISPYAPVASHLLWDSQIGLLG